MECRADDAATRTLLGPLDDAVTHRAVQAERRLLFELQGGCSIPMAAWAREVEDGLALDAAVFDPTGQVRLAAQRVGPREDPDALGRAVADSLRAQGAETLLAASRSQE